MKKDSEDKCKQIDINTVEGTFPILICKKDKVDNLKKTNDKVK
jgi:hypothetical protein